MNKLICAALSLALASCATTPGRSVASKPADPVSRSVAENLNALPKVAFEAIFGEGADTSRAEMLNGFKLTATPRAKAGPAEVYNPEAEKLQGDLTSSLVAINQDIFIEGFYRNAYWRQDGYRRGDQPWLAWDPAKKNYRLAERGAEAKLLAYYHAYGTGGRAEGPTVRLFRGTNKTELSSWLALRQRLASGDSSVGADLTKLAASRQNGYFFSNDESAAAGYGGDVELGAVVTIEISGASLDRLLSNGDIYVGYEKGYFEFSFLSAAAMAELARNVIPN